ncbi:MAG: deoxynucleoside kinase [Anaerolineae bacterium]
MNHHPFIAVEGVIGVGKTTLARRLQPEFGAHLLLEEFEENPFLADFYTDRERYAFQTQIFFLLSRYRQQQAVPTMHRQAPVISDYTFMKDRLFAYLNLRGDELAVYQSVYSALAENIPLPDLVVYLRAETDTLMERIAVRDRSYERDMDRNYIEALNRAYDGYFTAYGDSPVLVIDTDDLNIVAEPDDLDAVVGRVRAAIGQAVWQDPLPQLDPRETLTLAETERRLAHFQRFHQALDADKGFMTDVYFNFICLQEELGELAAELKAIWAETADGRADQHQAVARRLPALQAELADCLAYLLKLSNYLGIDLEEAYLDKMQANVGRTWRTREDRTG